jgi:hypothetical protein
MTEVTTCGLPDCVWVIVVVMSLGGKVTVDARLMVLTAGVGIKVTVLGTAVTIPGFWFTKPAQIPTK